MEEKGDIIGTDVEIKDDLRECLTIDFSPITNAVKGLSTLESSKSLLQETAMRLFARASFDNPSKSPIQIAKESLNRAAAFVIEYNKLIKEIEKRK